MGKCSKPSAAIEVSIILLAFILVNLGSQVFQEPVSLNGGRGWDGVEYYSMAEQFSQRKLPEAAAPFVYRIGTPLLASLFKHDLLLGFKVVNIVGNLITVILLTLWLRLYLQDWTIRAFLVLIFMAQWHGPVRYVYYHPAYIEPWLLAFLLMGLLAIQRVAVKPTFGKVACLTFVSFLGVAFREACLIIPIASLFAANPVARQDSLSAAPAQPTVSRMIGQTPTALFLPLAFALLSWLAVLYLVTPTSNYSYIKRAVVWGYNQSLALYIHSWFVAYGPVLVLLLYNWRRTGSFLRTNQFMLVYLLGLAALAWIGGTDTVKFLFWAMPVVYLLVGRAIEDNKELLTLPLVVVLVFCQLLSERVLWPVPDYPSPYSGGLILLTLLGSKIQYLDLSPSHGSRGIQIISLFQYLALSALILSWLYRRRGIVGKSRVSPTANPAADKAR
ncbi:MAG: hypothetical protein HY913_20205 [Desulfomonile tiedjei]|nr:hypothetical protein [Desulfomonile tiedjei]